MFIVSCYSYKDLIFYNCQTGGVNSVLSMEYFNSIPLVSNTPTIIFGMDVSHGAPGRSDVPSIAAVCSRIFLFHYNNEYIIKFTLFVLCPRL